MPRSRKFKYDVQMCKDLLNEIGGEKDPFLEHVRQLRYEGVLKIGYCDFEDSFLAYSSDYLIYAGQLIEALPDQKEEIISKFLNIFSQIRAETDRFYSISYRVYFMLQTEGIETAPFEIVKSFFKSIAAEHMGYYGESRCAIVIDKRHIASFNAHKQLANFLRDYYQTSIVYQGESLNAFNRSYCSYSVDDIKLLASLGINERMKVRNNGQQLKMKDLIEGYYVSNFVCKRFRKDLLDKSIVLAFQKVRENIQDCIESTYYGKLLDGIVKDEIMDFLYDIVLINKNGTRLVECEDFSIIEPLYDESMLSKYPVEQYKRSSRIRNKNRENFYRRKRRRNEHPFFGKQSKRKRKG